MPWMEEVKRLPSKTVINEFDIETEKLTKEINKRKNWAAPWKDRVQSFWWKTLVALKRIMFDNSMIPVRWLTGRVVLLAKTKDLNDENNYRPKTYLNTSHKILTDLIAKGMCEHTLVNKP